VAFVFDPNQDDDEAGSPRETVLSDTGGLIQGAGSSGGASPSQPKGTKSGSWTNLTNYLDANKGQGAVMGQAVRGTVDAVGSEAAAARSQFQTAGDSTVEQSTVKDQGIVGALGGFGKPTPKPQPVAAPQATTRPSAQVVSATGSTPKASNKRQATAVTAGRSPVAATEPPAPPPRPEIDQQQFNKQLTAQWQGPNAASEVTGYQDAYGKTQRLQNYADATQSYTDSGALLKDTYGRNGQQYRQGERMLDTFLLGGDPSGRAVLDDTYSTYKGSAQDFEGLLSGLNQKITQGRETTAKTRADTEAAVTGAKERFGSIFTADQAEAERKSKADQELYQALMAGDREALSQYGISDAEARALGEGYDFSNIFTGPKAYGLGDVASGENVGAYGQLMELLSGAGRGEASPYSFGKTGKGVDTVGEKLSAVDDFAMLKGDLDSRVTAANKARDDKLAALVKNAHVGGDTAMVARELGVSEGELRAALIHDPDAVRKLIQDGGELALGDVAKADELGQYTNLLSLLGGKTAVNTKASGTKDVAFDKATFAELARLGQSKLDKKQKDFDGSQAGKFFHRPGQNIAKDQPLTRSPDPVVTSKQVAQEKAQREHDEVVFKFKEAMSRDPAATYWLQVQYPDVAAELGLEPLTARGRR
jgi:hypothetical protein